MELTPEERQKIYLEEKARLEIRQELEAAAATAPAPSPAPVPGLMPPNKKMSTGTNQGVSPLTGASGRQFLVPSPLKDLIGDPLVYGNWCLRTELTEGEPTVAIVGEISSVDEPLSCEFSYALT